MSLTQKQEKFAQCIASGMSQSDAYREAYNVENSKDESIWCNASQLANDTKVKQRIKELQDILAEEVLYTAKQSFLKFIELQEKALIENNINAAIKAEELKGKLTGLYIDRQETTINGASKVTFEVADERDKG